jgi:ADP-ribosyltransferase exoenzyme
VAYEQRDRRSQDFGQGGRGDAAALGNIDEVLAKEILSAGKEGPAAAARFVNVLPGNMRDGALALLQQAFGPPFVHEVVNGPAQAQVPDPKIIDEWHMTLLRGGESAALAYFNTAIPYKDRGVYEDALKKKWGARIVNRALGRESFVEQEAKERLAKHAAQQNAKVGGALAELDDEGPEEMKAAPAAAAVAAPVAAPAPTAAPAPAPVAPVAAPAPVDGKAFLEQARAKVAAEKQWGNDFNTRNADVVAPAPTPTPAPAPTAAAPEAAPKPEAAAEPVSKEERRKCTRELDGLMDLYDSLKPDNPADVHKFIEAAKVIDKWREIFPAARDDNNAYDAPNPHKHLKTWDRLRESFMRKADAATKKAPAAPAAKAAEPEPEAKPVVKDVAAAAPPVVSAAPAPAPAPVAVKESGVSLHEAIAEAQAQPVAQKPRATAEQGMDSLATQGSFKYRLERVQQIREGIMSGTLDHVDPDVSPEVIAQMKKHLGKISNDQLAAIQGYTSEDYENLNRTMRRPGADAKRTELLSGYIEEVRTGLAALPSYEGEVYRGLNLVPAIWAEWEKAFESGGTVADKAFSSSSTDTGIAEGFLKKGRAENKIPVYAQVLSRSGKQVEFISRSAFEHEVLFAGGAKFKVISIADGIGPDGLPRKEVFLREVLDEGAA